MALHDKIVFYWLKYLYLELYIDRFIDQENDDLMNVKCIGIEDLNPLVVHLKKDISVQLKADIFLKEEGAV